MKNLNNEAILRILICVIMIIFAIIMVLAATEDRVIACQTKQIHVVYNYNKLEFANGYPQLYNNRIYFPLRATGEIFGYTIEWNHLEQYATLRNTNNSQVIKFYSDSNVIYINGKKGKMQYETINIDGRLFIPVRFMADILGLKLKFVSKENTLYMYDPDIQPKILKYN